MEVWKCKLITYAGGVIIPDFVLRSSQQLFRGNSGKMITLCINEARDAIFID